MQYYADGDTRVARLLPDGTAEQFIGSRNAWVEVPNLQVEMRFSGNFYPVSESQGQAVARGLLDRYGPPQVSTG